MSLIHQGLHLIDLGDVGLDDQRLASQRLNFRLDGFDFLLTLVRIFCQDHVSAGLRQSKRDRPADPLGGSGDDRDFVLQSEARVIYSAHRDRLYSTRYSLRSVLTEGDTITYL